jgi:hypothetical protein
MKSMMAAVINKERQQEEAHRSRPSVSFCSSKPQTFYTLPQMTPQTANDAPNDSLGESHSETAKNNNEEN